MDKAPENIFEKIGVDFEKIRVYQEQIRVDCEKIHVQLDYLEACIREDTSQAPSSSSLIFSLKRFYLSCYKVTNRTLN